MLRELARNWWALALRGLVAVLFGLVAIIWPDITLRALVALFGAFALVDGALTIFAVFSGETTDRWWYVFEGALGIAVGVIAWVWPDQTARSLLAFIAAWAIVTGVLEIIAAIRLRSVIADAWLLGLGGLASVLLGAVLAIRPGEGALALVTVIGIYAIAYGVLQIAVGLHLRGVGGRLERFSSGGGNPATGGAAAKG